MSLGSRHTWNINGLVYERNGYRNSKGQVTSFDAAIRRSSITRTKVKNIIIIEFGLILSTPSKLERMFILRDAPQTAPPPVSEAR